VKVQRCILHLRLAKTPTRGPARDLHTKDWTLESRASQNRGDVAYASHRIYGSPRVFHKRAALA
jgi:hypothetical protein